MREGVSRRARPLRREQIPDGGKRGAGEGEIREMRHFALSCEQRVNICRKRFGVLGRIYFGGLNSGRRITGKEFGGASDEKEKEKMGQRCV